MPEYTYAKGRIAETVQFITKEMIKRSVDAILERESKKEV